MGIFAKKKRHPDGSSVVSALSGDSDISDDYVAPSIADVEAGEGGRVREEAAERPAGTGLDDGRHTYIGRSERREASGGLEEEYLIAEALALAGERPLDDDDDEEEERVETNDDDVEEGGGPRRRPRRPSSLEALRDGASSFERSLEGSLEDSLGSAADAAGELLERTGDVAGGLLERTTSLLEGTLENAADAVGDVAEAAMERAPSVEEAKGLAVLAGLARTTPPRRSAESPGGRARSRREEVTDGYVRVGDERKGGSSPRRLGLEVSPLSSNEAGRERSHRGGGGGGARGSNALSFDDEDVVNVGEEDAFDGVRGTVQPPRYRDVCFAWLFVLHFGAVGWWFVDSFVPNYNSYNGSYYSKTNHVGLSMYVATTGLAGLGLAFFAFGYVLRHGETFLKTVVILSTAMCLGVGMTGLFIGEMFVCVAGIVGFVVASMYTNVVWKKLPFTASNISVAVSAIRENMGLFLGALLVASIGFVWAGVAVTAGVAARQMHGGWTLWVGLFSYYWTHQVLTNAVAVATAGIVGRWFVTGEKTPTFDVGLKEMFARVRTHYFGSICYGSLFLGVIHTVWGLRNFLVDKRVPLLPSILSLILWVIAGAVDAANEWAYVYVGLYGYSYAAAARNATELLENRGWDGIAKRYLATNVLFMANMAIGLLTGVCGLVFGVYKYRIMYRSGFNNPSTEGFFIGFLVGFLMSSILLSVVTATVNTLVVCLAESPDAFKTNHPDLSNKLNSAWKKMVKDTRSDR